MNTYQTVKLSNGQDIKLTLNLKRLLLLKSKKRDLYLEANKIVTKGPEDIEDMAKIVYVAYLCALETGVQEIPYATFIELVPQELGEITSLAADLVSPKKK